MITRELGVTYDHKGTLVVTVELADDGVVVLVLMDDERWTKPLKAGLVMTIVEDTDFWCRASVRFSPRRG